MILALAALERSIRNVAGNNRRLRRGQNAMKNKKIGNFLFNECLYESNYDLLELFFHKNKNE